MSNNWFLNPDLQQRLDAISGITATYGNKVSLLSEGSAAFNLRYENIENADFIFIKTYEFWGDQIGRELIAKLAKRAQAGTTIFIQFDVKGIVTTHSQLELLVKGKTSPIPEYLSQLQQQAPDHVFLIPTSVPWHFRERIASFFTARLPHDHEKYFITWSRTPSASLKAIVGSRNIGEEYAFGGQYDHNGEYKLVDRYQHCGFRELEVEIEGPATLQILERFLDSAKFHATNPNSYLKTHLASNFKDGINKLNTAYQEILLNKQESCREKGRACIRFIPQEAPLLRSNSKGAGKIEECVGAILSHVPSSNAVTLSTGFWALPASFVSMLKACAKRGVSFKCLLNGLNSMDMDIWLHAKGARHAYRKLWKEVPSELLTVCEWLPSNKDGYSYIHQKVASFGDGMDDPYMLGSWNLSQYSMRLVSECALIISDPTTKTEFNKLMIEDFKRSWVNELKTADIQGAWTDRVIEWLIAEGVFGVLLEKVVPFVLFQTLYKNKKLSDKNKILKN